MKIGAIGHTMYKGSNTSFLGANFLLRQGAGIKGDELKFEFDQAQKAREAGVSVPKYKMQSDEESGSIRQIRYKTEGDTADIKTNPISSRHFRILLKNLYFMDAAGIFHNNLNPKHVFFQNDGRVEFDDFRHTTNFYKRYTGTTSLQGKEINIPDFMLPSNEESFREHSLSRYIEDVDKADKTYFMKRYLQERSEYHEKRTDLLLKRRFGPDNKTTRYEIIQSLVFAAPSYQVIGFELDKLNIYRQKEEALEQWASGAGEKEDKAAPGKRFSAFLIYLDCIENAATLRDAAEYLSKTAKTADEREYFRFETECAQKRLEEYYKEALNMGRQNFNDEELNIFLGTQDEKEFFTEQQFIKS